MIYSRYPLKVLQEVEPFPPIQNTDNPYATEAAMHADQANQLEGYGYLVDGVGAFTYLGTVAETAADYEGFGGGTANITPNDYTGTDTARIQQSIDDGSITGTSVVIPKKDDINTPYDIENALLLKSNTTITVDGAILKLTDTSRDNMFRTENCGLGLSAPFTVLENIHIDFINGATCQGADNPRASGDAGKTLVIDTTNDLTHSYGTDTGVGGETQTGDWRNIMFLFAYTKNYSIKGAYIVNSHMWAISNEKCSGGRFYNLKYNINSTRTIPSVGVRYIKNGDGLDFRMGCSDMIVDDVTGHTDDDTIALTIISQNLDAGIYGTYEVTGSTYISSIHDINNVTVKNLNTSTVNNNIRLLNTQGTKIHDINLQNIYDRDYSSIDGSSLIQIGSATYGTPADLGEMYNLIINNVKNISRKYCVYINGSLSESEISNAIDLTAINALPPIYVNPSGKGTRNILTSNIFKKNYNIDLSSFINGISAKKSGLKINKNSKNLQLYDELRVVDGEIVVKDMLSPTEIKYFWSGTQAQYDAIVVKEVSTIYLILG